jgi:hypothetical protein
MSRRVHRPDDLVLPGPGEGGHGLGGARRGPAVCCARAGCAVPGRAGLSTDTLRCVRCPSLPCLDCSALRWCWLDSTRRVLSARFPPCVSLPPFPPFGLLTPLRPLPFGASACVDLPVAGGLVPCDAALYRGIPKRPTHMQVCRETPFPQPRLRAPPFLTCIRCKAPNF